MALGTSTSAVAPVGGLILGGGQSRRFGQAKINFRPDASAPPWGVTRWEQLHALVSPVAFSLRPGQPLDFALPPRSIRIDDDEADGGPLSGLLSAWRREPTTAWLVVACDLAALDGATLHALLSARRADLLATAFRVPETDGGVEPLCALYEPASRERLEARFLENRRSLRRFLLDEASAGQVQLIAPPRLEALRSRNFA